MDYYKASLELHRKHRGKLSVCSKVPVKNKDDLSLAYTPGVAQPCKEIAEDPALVYEYTSKGNMVAVVTDGSAVLGLGNIGPRAALPVMEGKAVLFKEFAGVDAVPICLETQDADAIVEAIRLIAPAFGGINLEDIAAPRCFDIEERAQALVDIPVFHDDQHGTAIVTAAAALNAMKVVEKDLAGARVVISGAGSAGTAVARMLLALGVKDIVVCDRMGILNANDAQGLNPAMAGLAADTNPRRLSGGLARAMEGADLFIGLSAPGVVTEAMVASMAHDSVVFPMANPEPEITPEQAKAAGAAIVGTGRSDYPNQINNVLAFPGVFKGALSVRAKRITPAMKIAAARAIAASVPAEDLSPDCIIPSPFNPAVAQNVAQAVAGAWREEEK